jgi:polyisoprenoid-binding protein YceI
MPASLTALKPAPVRGGLLAAALLAGAHLAAAQAPVAQAPAAPEKQTVYLIDPAHTHIQWEVRHFGTSTSRGRFDDIAGHVALDRAAQQGEASITIGTASINSGVAPLDTILRSHSFLDVKNHPQAYFVASRFRFADGKPVELRGELTLHGASQPLSLRAVSFNCYEHPVLKREVCGGDFEAEFSRSGFGITYGLPVVGDTVKLQIGIEAIRQ